MNSTTYRELLAYAGRSLLREHPWPIRAGVPFPLDPQAAVYLACDTAGHCLYVGSVARQAGSGLAARVAEHLADPNKRAAWDHLWVIPLRPETDVSHVRRIEGIVGAHIGPSHNRRLPAM